jgi:hypothetical protein
MTRPSTAQMPSKAPSLSNPTRSTLNLRTRAPKLRRSPCEPVGDPFGDTMSLFDGTGDAKLPLTSETPLKCWVAEFN